MMNKMKHTVNIAALLPIKRKELAKIMIYSSLMQYRYKRGKNCDAMEIIMD